MVGIGSVKSFLHATSTLDQRHLLEEERLQSSGYIGFTLPTTILGSNRSFISFYCYLLQTITQPACHGMLFVPIGYTFGAGMFKMDSIRGGTPYGAGDGTRETSGTELTFAEHEGKHIAAVVKKLVQN
ncbi:hypothetical protein RDI58_004384 [Solanum bulbocastanum]|uniref:Flavoprotein wrbA n=1 Tax=Solanum bulbocastanum TaxID=147425 RepID=A0AAN8TXL2_SOLBU